MTGLPKSIIKKYGITKKAWRMYRAGKGKSNPKRSVKTTVKRKRRRFYRAKRRTRRDNRMPLSLGVGLATSVFAPPAPGWGSAFEKIQAGDIAASAQSFIRSWTGFAIGGIGGQSQNYFNLFDTLNPLNMNEAPAWKATFWTSILAKLVKTFIKKDPFSKIPIVKKFVKFS